MIRITIGHFDEVFYIPDGTPVAFGRRSIRFGDRFLAANLTDFDTDIFQIEKAVETADGETFWQTLFMKTPEVQENESCRSLVMLAFEEYFRKMEPRKIRDDRTTTTNNKEA